MIFSLIENMTLADWVAAIVAVVGLFGGFQGMRTFIKRMNRIVVVADSMDQKLKDFDQLKGSVNTVKDEVSGIRQSLKTDEATFLSRLAAAEARFFAKMQAYEYACFVADETGNITDANQAFLLLLGRTQTEEVTGAAWLEAIHESDRDRIERRWKNWSAGVSGGRMTDRFHLVSANGEKGKEIELVAFRRGDVTLKVAAIFGRLTEVSRAAKG